MIFYLNILNNLSTFQTLTVTPPKREQASVVAFGGKKLILKQFSDEWRCFSLKRSHGVCSRAQFVAVYHPVCWLFGFVLHR